MFVENEVLGEKLLRVFHLFLYGEATACCLYQEFSYILYSKEAKVGGLLNEFGECSSGNIQGVSD